MDCRPVVVAVIIDSSVPTNDMCRFILRSKYAVLVKHSETISWAAPLFDARAVNCQICATR